MCSKETSDISSIKLNIVSQTWIRAPLAFQVHVPSEKELEVQKYISSSRYKAVAPIFPIPTDPNDIHYRKRPCLSHTITGQSPEHTIWMCQCLTFVLNTEARILKYYKQDLPYRSHLQTLRSGPRSSGVWQIIAHFPCLHFCAFI